MREAVQQPEITAEWLFARVIDRGDGCLVWRGGCCNGGKDPRAKINSRKVNVRRAVWAALHGRQPRADQIVRARCETPGCCEPSHLVSLVRSRAYSGKPKSLTHRAAIAKGKRKRSKLPQEIIPQILASPLSCKRESEKHGISKDMVRQIRAGRLRRDYTSPFAALGA